jgi:hypothetical protein
MKSLHISFLNSAYNNDVNNDWDSLGCMDSIRQRLGYRLVLKDARFPRRAVAGRLLAFDLHLENVGYASPYNPRSVQLVLRNRNSRIETLISSGVDVRRWYSGDIRWKEVLKLPADLPAGDYDVLLALRDPYPAIAQRPEYSIRLANENCWEAATGYNDLHVRLTIFK